MNFLHKWLQRRVSPAGFERLSAAVLPWLAPLAWALLAVGAVWGLAFAPMVFALFTSMYRRRCCR